MWNDYTKKDNGTHIIQLSQESQGHSSFIPHQRFSHLCKQSRVGKTILSTSQGLYENCRFEFFYPRWIFETNPKSQLLSRMLYFLWIDIYSLHRFWSGPYPWCTIMRTKNIKKSKRNLSSLSWISCTSAIMSYTLIYWRICLSLFKYLESHPSPSSRISMN